MVDKEEGAEAEPSKVNPCCATPGRAFKGNEAASGVDKRAARSGVVGEY